MDTLKHVTAVAPISTAANPHRWLILGICCLSLLIVGLDMSIVNVALPAIHRSFRSSLAGLQWIVDAYTLVVASLLILSGSCCDRFGRKRVFIAGLLTFTAGSAICAVAPSLGILIAARALQAVGGSMLNPIALSIVRNVFTEPRERAQAIGLWGAMVGASIALGPVLGGAFVDTIGWRFVFLVNVPVGLLAVVLTTIYIPESRAEHARRLDPIGQILVISGLASLTYAIIEGRPDGWTSTTILLLFGVALFAFTGLVAYELRHDEPLINFRFFRSAPFSGASAIAFCALAAFGAFLLLNTLYLQEARGYSAFRAGLATLPLAAFTIILPPVSGRLVASRGTRPPLLVAGIGMLAGPLLLTRLTVHTPFALLLVSYGLFGIGFGCVNAPITVTAVSGMPASQTGVAAAIASTSRQIGVTIGIALAGALVGGAAGEGSSSSLGHRFAQATHPAWWMMSGFAFAVLIIGVVTTSGWASETARATATRLAPEHAGA
jgi:EmrB/QacA subfamily drug resistance transporter